MYCETKENVYFLCFSNSYYSSWACCQIFLCSERHTNEAKGSMQSWIDHFASFACQTADNCDKSYWITLCSNEWSTMTGLQCHAIENKNRNHLINQLKKLGYENDWHLKNSPRFKSAFFRWALFGEAVSMGQIFTALWLPYFGSRLWVLNLV